MKTNFPKRWALGTAIAACCLAGGQSWQIAKAEEIATPATSPSSEVAATPTDSAPSPPTNVYPSSPLAQVIRLLQAGVSEDVIMTYVTNSGSTFNLDPDKIIYLKDVGAPDELVTAMIQRDQVLHQQMATYQPPQPPPTTTETPSPPDLAVNTPVETEPPPEQPAEVTVNNFYYTLAPYGAWIDLDGYGRCWRPTVLVYNSGWRPYCDHGRWVYTDCGWYWFSDYSWGWAAFHYGRWFNHPRYGWCWYPGAVWGPSWVTWRYADNYCGWAPLPPFTAYTTGVGFTYRGVSVSASFNFGLAANCFTFVPTRNFCDPHPQRYCVAQTQVTQIYNQTTVINNISVNSHNQTIVNEGIEPQKIASVTRTEIHPLTIRETSTPVTHGEQLGRDGRTLLVNRKNFMGNPTVPNRQIGSPFTTPVAQPSPHSTVGSPYQPQNNVAEKNYPGNNNLQPQRYSQPVPSPQGNWQHAYTYSAPAPGSPTLQNPTVVSHSASGTAVPPNTPNDNWNNSIDNRRYPTPRMQQFDQQSQHGESQPQHDADASKNAESNSSHSDNSQSQSANGQSQGQSASRSSSSNQSQRGGHGKNQNGQ